MRHSNNLAKWLAQEWIPFRSAVLLVFACVLLNVQESAAQGANDRIFTIAKYPVDGTAQNAVAAKRDAIRQGRQAAFRSLLKRLVPAESQPLIEQLQKLDPSIYLGGMKVRSEENSRTQYIATLDFSFEPDAIRGLLGQHNVPYLDQPAPETALMLIYSAPPNASGAQSGARGAAAWQSVWAGLDLSNSLAPVRIVRKPDNLGAELLRQLQQADASALAALGRDHQTSQIVIADARPDPAGKALHITLSGQDAVGRFTVSTRYGLDDDFVYSLELAAVIAQGVLESRWKADKTGPTTGGSGLASGAATQLQVLAEFGNLGQWQRQQKVLATTPGVRNMQVGSLSGRSASISLTFPGGGDNLQAVLQARGLVLENINGFWILR